MQRHESLVEDAKKWLSQYKKEAQNCNIGVRSCEGTREIAQEELVNELKLTTLW